MTGRRVLATTVGWLVAVLTAGSLVPVEAGSKPKPETVSLRLGSATQKTVLVPPGLAMSRASRTLTPGGSLSFLSESLRRAVSIDGHPFLRLHLSHTVPGDVVLYVRVEAISGAGVLRTLLPQLSMAAPEAMLTRGPAANIDLRMPRLRSRLAVDDRLQLVISELGNPTDPLHPDVITVYLGALPGEDENVHDVGQVFDESNGGKNPARLSLSAIGEGPFQRW